MVKAIKAWLASVRLARDRVEYERGRNWAAAELRAGRMSEECIDARISPPFANDPFDYGARDFLTHYKGSTCPTNPHSTN